jgi:aldose 1-epimerase
MLTRRQLTPVRLRAGALEAIFVPAAGLVGTSLRHDGEELLHPRDGLDAYARTGATMGIPFLHPWANRLDDPLPGADVPRDEHGLPIHGFLPGAWTVEEATAATLTARLDIDDPLFPHPHRCRQRVSLTSRALRIETTVEAPPGGPVPVAFGFHPYLTLPGAPRARWRVELPARRRLATDERGIPTGERRGEPAEAFALGDRTFDDGYDGLPPDPVFAVEGGGRRVEVRFGAGYPVAQVFAPPAQDVICFEPMTAPTNALRSGDGLRHVPSGGRSTAAFAIAVA